MKDLKGGELSREEVHKLTKVFEYLLEGEDVVLKGRNWCISHTDDNSYDLTVPTGGDETGRTIYLRSHMSFGQFIQEFKGEWRNFLYSGHSQENENYGRARYKMELEYL